MNFEKVDIKKLDENMISLFDDSWTLITAGNETDGFNTMTASWGGMGKLWGKNVCFIFIRPQRYTYEFIEKHEEFSLSFFGEDFKKALVFCGRNSGRDVDKMKETGLTPKSLDGTVSFEQAQLIMTCKKLAFQDIDPKGFLDPTIQSNYELLDYHRMYIGEIVECYKK